MVRVILVVYGLHIMLQLGGLRMVRLGKDHPYIMLSLSEKRRYVR